MLPVYFISGLGADERVFRNVNIPGASVRYLRWTSPAKEESIESYAHRLMMQCTEENPVLVGLSFGGMMAIEMSRLMAVRKVILISSVKNRDELPPWMKISGKLKLPQLLPDRKLSSFRAYKLLRPFQNYFLGVTNDEERRIANEYRDNVDPQYLKWSISQVCSWQSPQLPEEIYHIHGTADHIFPIHRIKPTHTIEGGGHFMIMNKTDQINAILHSLIMNGRGSSPAL